ncbi:hypothetical protein AGOR_G00079650 [Albula goreensis]|uniref:Uncharacterized protein n=1 Tax=Albula goreensis TaxID=1534307 RepID=A0A8T3DJG0_9TELE|nr:hypothetical protein AGOR_G00079650 [Albula goreensis]
MNLRADERSSVLLQIQMKEQKHLECSLEQSSTCAETSPAKHCGIEEEQARVWERNLDMLEEVLLIMQLELVQLMERVRASLDRRLKQWARGMEGWKMGIPGGEKGARDHARLQGDAEAKRRIVTAAEREMAEVEESRKELHRLDGAFWSFAGGMQDRVVHLWKLLRKEGTSERHSVQVTGSVHQTPASAPQGGLEQRVSHGEATPAQALGRETEWGQAWEESLGAVQEGRLVLQLGLVQVLEEIMAHLDRGIQLWDQAREAEEARLALAERWREENGEWMAEHEEGVGMKRRSGVAGELEGYVAGLRRSVGATRSRIQEMKEWRAELDGAGEAYCRFSMEMERRMIELREATAADGTSKQSCGRGRLAGLAVDDSLSGTKPACQLCSSASPPTEDSTPPTSLSVASLDEDRLERGASVLCPETEARAEQRPLSVAQSPSITQDLRQQAETQEENQMQQEEESRKGGRSKPLKRFTEWFRTLLSVRCFQ